MTARSLVVVSAGLSQPSSTRLLADRLAAAVGAALAVETTVIEAVETTIEALETTVIEVRDHAHDVVNHVLTGFPPPSLAPALEAVTRADGLITVTPIFNASYSGLFKSFFDVLDETALVDKPVLLGATGGTARHSLALEHALRPMFAHLRASVVATSVYAAPEDWSGAGGRQDGLARRIERAGRELAEQMARRRTPPADDPFEVPVTFDRLLAGE